MTNAEGAQITKGCLTVTAWVLSFGFNSSFGIRASSFSIHIPLVALLALQFLDVFVCLIDALAALLLHNVSQDCIHVFGHASCITAHEKLAALSVDPFPDLSRILSQLVLYIDLVR